MTVEITNLKAVYGTSSVDLRWEVNTTVSLVGFLVESKAGTGTWMKSPQLPAEQRHYVLTLPVGPASVRVWPVVAVIAASSTGTVGESKPATFYPGVNSHASWFWEVTATEVELEIAEAQVLGVNHVRIPVEWGALEPVQGQRPMSEALARLDLIVGMAAARGILVNGTIDPTPTWASSGGGWNCAPSDPEVVRPFAKWLCQRYGSKLVAVGCLNEPNVTGNYLKPNGSPFASINELAEWYVRQANAIFLGAHEGNPAIKVLAGESGNAQNYLGLVLPTVKCDAIGLHAYSDGTPPESSGSNSTKSKVEEAHRLAPNLPIWVCEWGYSNENPEATQAGYTEKGVRMLRSMPYVEGHAYYQLHDTNVGTGPEENFGLCRKDFSHRLTFGGFKAGMS